MQLKFSGKKKQKPAQVWKKNKRVLSAPEIHLMRQSKLKEISNSNWLIAALSAYGDVLLQYDIFEAPC